MAPMKMVLALSLLLLIALVDESRTVGNDATGDAKGDAAPTLVCNSVHAAEDGDTCSSVAQQFNLSSQEFSEINPKINCDSIFIGQWLCVDGSQSP